MKKLILIIVVLFCAVIPAQTDSDLELLFRASDFEEDGGNLFASGMVGLYSGDVPKLALKVSPAAPFELALTGAAIDIVHAGTYAVDFTIIEATPIFNIVDTDANTGGGASTYDSSAVVIDTDGKAIINMYSVNGGHVGIGSDASGVTGILQTTGTTRFQWTSAYFGGGSSVRGAISNDNSSLTVPTLVPRWVDLTTGYGGIADTNSIIVGNVSIAKFGADGMMLGNPTGAYKGVGTLNAKAVYDDNTILTGDYVFSSNYNALTIKEMKYFYEQKNHLPWLTGQAEMIERGNISLGERLNETIVALENQAKYIVELERRLSELEK